MSMLPVINPQAHRDGAGAQHLVPASRSDCLLVFLESLVPIIVMDGFFTVMVGAVLESRPAIPSLAIYFGLMSSSSAAMLAGGICGAAQQRQRCVFLWQLGLCGSRLLLLVIGAAWIVKNTQGAISSMSTTLFVIMVILLIALIVVFAIFAWVHVCLFIDATRVVAGQEGAVGPVVAGAIWRFVCWCASMVPHLWCAQNHSTEHATQELQRLDGTRNLFTWFSHCAGDLEEAKALLDDSSDNLSLL
ncbi:hypothetical protein OG21DRAFT_1336386 [Imleria badia]|nr:hypothetical protein OG21DRAFT_1336386 [Imleria badia]